MLEDTFEGLEDDDMEEAADEEVEKILFEVTEGLWTTQNIYLLLVLDIYLAHLY